MTPAELDALVERVKDPRAVERAEPVTSADWNVEFVRQTGEILALRKDVAFLRRLLQERDDAIRMLADLLDATPEGEDDESDDAVSTESEHGRSDHRRNANGGDAPAAPDQIADQGEEAAAEEIAR